ncbi:ABC transporter permease [Roseiflexus sp.]|uniref:ABC transporter permease n=1 Tax=Roseiflexus sp. TaxID=2562120 RepID=UPI00398A58C8
MKCPHCGESLRYRERSNQTCSKCHQRFALEPKLDPLKLSDRKLRSLAERLSRKGVYRYTIAHLYHAAILQWVKHIYRERFSWPYKTSLSDILYQSRLTQIALIGLTGIWFFFYLESQTFSASGFWPTIKMIFGGCGILAMATPAAVAELIGKIRGSGKLPDVSLADFEHKCLAPWEMMYGQLPGKIDSADVLRLRASFSNPPRHRIRAFIVSPNEDILDCLRANDLPQRLGVALINPDHPLTGEMEDLVRFARNNPRLPILMIHDASVWGCLLPYLLPAKWGLTADHRVIDLGLRPHHVRQLQLPWRYERVPSELRRLLDNVARKPDNPFLHRDEVDWLREGSVASALFIPPSKLIAVVTKTVKQTAPRLVDPEVEAQAQARAIGFMTWPQQSVR